MRRESTPALQPLPAADGITKARVLVDRPEETAARRGAAQRRCERERSGNERLGAMVAFVSGPIRVRRHGLLRSPASSHPFVSFVSSVPS